MYNAPYQGVANNLAQYGRYGDSQLVHMNPIEVQMLSRLSPTGKLTLNPTTGQPEAFLPFLAPLLGSFLGSSLLTGAGAGLLGAAGLSPLVAGAIGSGLTTAAVTGDLEQGIMAGITGFGIGSALGGLGGLGAGADAATKAATDVATQGATQAATTAIPEAFVNAATLPSADALAAGATGATPISANIPASFMDASSIPSADMFMLDAAGSTPLSAGTSQFGVPQDLGSTFSRLSAMSPEELVNLPAPPPTMAQRFAQPFQQPGQFISNLAKPESFLPIYAGETGREARRQEIAGEGSARAYEEEQEATKNRIRGQMSDVFNQVRSAYPGRGYAAGGIVERYAEGGFNIDQDLVNSLRFSGLPVAKSVQEDLRGPRFVPPPASSYSALDVGGEGYLAGVAPEFQYFYPALPPEPIDETRPPGGTPPGGPDLNQPIMGPGYGGFLDDYLRNYGGGPGRGGMADDMSDFTGRPGRGDMDMPVYTGGSPNFDFTGGMADDTPAYTGGSPNFDEGGFDRSIMEELLNSQFNPIRDRLSAIETQPSAPDFDYSRIPAYTPPDFSGIEDRLASIESRPQPSFDYDRIPQFDMSMIEDRLSGLETGVGSIGNRQIDFSPIEQRLAAIESRPMPEFDYSRIPSYTPPDFSGIEDRLANIESRPMPQFDYDRIPQFDMSPIQQQIADLQSGIGSLQNRPQPSFDLSGLEQRLASMESRGTPQVSFDPIMERLSSLESLLASQRSAPSQNMSSFQNPFDEFSMSDGFAEGGMTGMDNQSQMGDENSIVEMTVAAIRGEIENADQIISRFVEMYGPEVFTQLRERVLQDIVPGAQTNGMVEGEGGGQDDLVEGMIGTQRPVAVSPGEYIIPADVVSLAGGGYSGNGASFFDGLVDDIRQKTMGTTKQVRPYQRSA